jgi:hypothetical protein
MWFILLLLFLSLAFLYTLANEETKNGRVCAGIFLGMLASAIGYEYRSFALVQNDLFYACAEIPKSVPDQVVECQPHLTVQIKNGAIVNVIYKDYRLKSAGTKAEKK